MNNKFLGPISLPEQGSVPTPVSGMLSLYAKYDGLYFKRDDGVEVGPLNADVTPSDMVTLSTEQTINGIKTFSVAPIVPDASFTIAKTSGLQTALDSKYSATNAPPAPTNMVTTDTTQTISGTKTFDSAPVVPDSSFGVGKLSATGTKDSTTFLRGDNTWGTPTFTAPSNMVTTNSDQTISNAKTFSARTYFTGTAIHVRNGLFNELRLEASSPSNANSLTVGTTPPLTFASKYWNGSASVEDPIQIKTFRRSHTANDRYLNIDGETRIALLYEADNRVYSAGNKVPVSGISATGTADATTYLRGDGSWATVTAGGSGATATNVVTSTLTTAHKHTVSASTAPPAAPAVGDLWTVTDINTGSAISAGGGTPANMVTLDTAQTISAAKTFSVAPVVPAASFEIGVLNTTGVATASTFLRGDGAWTAIAAPDLSNYVTLNGTQTISGTKTFTAAPVLPDASVSLAAIAATGTRDATTSLRGDGTWVAVNPVTVPFSYAGTLTTKTGAMKFPIAVACTVESVMITAGTASAGAAIIADVNRNGTTIYTTQANRPMLAAGAVIATAPSPAVTTFAAGDYITVDIDQVGTTTAGADVMVVIRLRRT